jgi:hypothetical protein
VTDFVYQEKKRNSSTDECLPKHHRFWIIQFSNVLKCALHTNSKIVERFEKFLFKELHHSPEGVPEHPLWGSFYQDLGASESTQLIRKNLNMLRDTQSHLESLNVRVEVEEIPLTRGTPARSGLS